MIQIINVMQRNFHHSSSSANVLSSWNLLIFSLNLFVYDLLIVLAIGQNDFQYDDLKSIFV